MALPVTGMFMRSRLPLQHRGVIKPVRQSRATCLVYMESQASALPRYWPDPATAVRMKTCRWTISTDKKKTTTRWKKIVETGIKWGSP